MISVGVCAVRKGLHFALEAWLRVSGFKRRHISHCGRISVGLSGKTGTDARASQRESSGTPARRAGIVAEE